VITSSIVKTAFGEPYMKRLCRHFAHKIPTLVEGLHGTIEFPFGLCRIEVDEREMRFRVDVDDEANADRAEKVVADHLMRMANRDEPVVEWIRDA